MALTPHFSISPFSGTSAGVLGLAGALALAAAPAQAAELPASAPVTGASPLALAQTFDTTTYDADAEAAEWRRCGWRGCYGRGWNRHRHRGVRAGDVLAGVAIVGGIAAIASAANNNRRRDRDVVIVERDRTIDRNRYDDRDYERELERDREIEELRRRSDEQQREIEYLRSRGLDASRLSNSQVRQSVLPPVSAPLTIDGAIDRCTEVVGIDSAISGVDGVDRTGTGWSVRGQLTDGQSFSCDIGSDGRIERLGDGSFSSGGARGFDGYETQRAESQPVGGQWSADRYADARGSLAANSIGAAPDYGQPLVPLTAERMPAYPGGPVPGE